MVSGDIDDDVRNRIETGHGFGDFERARDGLSRRIFIRDDALLYAFCRSRSASENIESFFGDFTDEDTRLARADIDTYEYFTCFIGHFASMIGRSKGISRLRG